VPLWKRLSKYTQGVILIMVSVMFFVWGIFGGAQVEKQNDTIAARVARQHTELQQHMDASLKELELNQDILLAEGRYITCILLTLPERRTPKQVHRCVRESGLKDIRNGGES